METFQAIKEYADEYEEVSISHLCHILKVSRSGYYKWLQHQETTSEQENLGLMDIIKKLHSQHNRNFTATAPNQKWCTDVTFLKYGFSCKAYLSAIKDLYDGSIVAYVVGQFNDNELVLETLRKAQKANPNATPLIHSDRGSQYTSKDYYRLTTQYQMTRSMSRVGKCIDNAPIESFFGHFKTECYDLKKYKTFEELVSDIDAYIYFYNHQRFQERNNGLAPLEMRNKAVA